MNGLFFTGTDTAVGKTTIAAGVARLLRRQDRDCRVCKPIATGARHIDGHWLSDDTVRLAEAAGQVNDWQHITPWAFPDPVAPPVAARRSGVELTLEQVIAAVRGQHQPGACLLVEGVGGLLCPLTENESVADLVAGLGLPVI